MKKYKKSTLLIAVCLLVVMVCLSLFGCQSNTDANQRRHVNSINHRGYSDAPENTLSAFRLSKEKGFDMVECDVRFTEDNIPVLLHDDSVNRTSNGRGKISKMTLEEVRELDFGSWKSKKYAEERIPTFNEFIDLCVELDLYPYIDVKKDVTIEQTRVLLDIVDEADIPVTWISFDKNIISFIADSHPGARVGLLTLIITAGNLKYLAQLKNVADVFIDAQHTLVTQADIKQCKKYNIPLEIWTINSRNGIAKVDPYITGITSDYVNAQDLFNNL